MLLAYIEPSDIEYLQHRYKWNNAITLQISWRSLQIGIKRIHRSTLLTNICNGILPTMKVLKPWRHRKNDKCVLCGKCETQDHLVLCKDPSRQKWKSKYMISLRKVMTRLKTNNHTMDLFCSSVTD